MPVFNEPMPVRASNDNHAGMKPIEFLQMQMTVSQGKVVYGGEVLATSKEEVTVKLVKDGARVR